MRHSRVMELVSYRSVPVELYESLLIVLVCCSCHDDGVTTSNLCNIFAALISDPATSVRTFFARSCKGLLDNYRRRLLRARFACLA
mmetsp:Transcript_62497/g.129653  ORF Transcript_62497/g.129653 Transcript_62497/m.129653 type:complete len:86 (-) Transcript_62497:93-350(-)